MMKVLVAYKTGSSLNPYVDELVKAMERQGALVTWSLEDFWQCQGQYDVVHIHWPEYLYYPGESFDMDRLQQVLQTWKKHAVIVMTAHNLRPHNVDPQGKSLYDTVYASLDGMLHLGKFSLEKSKVDLPWIKHGLTKHHSYIADLDRGSSTTQRSRGAKEILVFGNLRHDSERQLVKGLFRYFRGQPVHLHVPRWRKRPSNMRFYLRAWNHALFAFEKLKYGSSIGWNFIPDEAITTLYLQSDLVFIPRIDSLNSGVVFQAFSYGKAVIGPRLGNISGILEETGNFIYSPGNLDDASKTIFEALQAPLEEIGKNNREFAQRALHPDVIANEHLNFFSSLLQ